MADANKGQQKGGGKKGGGKQQQQQEKGSAPTETKQPAATSNNATSPSPAPAANTTTTTAAASTPAVAEAKPQQQQQQEKGKKGKGGNKDTTNNNNAVEKNKPESSGTTSQAPPPSTQPTTTAAPVSNAVGQVAAVADANNNNNTASPSTPKKSQQQQGGGAPAEKGQGQSKKEGQQNKSSFNREKGRGVVKAVLSGDTIVVIHLEKTQQGPPTEREITISNVSAPRIGKPKTQKREAVEDEPFAWGSREFLRKKAIGKQVIYTIEYKTPSNKEYGVVGFVNPKTNEPEDLAKLIVAEGWAKVRRPTGKDVRPEVEDLIKLEEEAHKAEKGLFAPLATQEEVNASKRSFAEFKPTELFERLRGKPQNAVIEKVRNGSTLQVTIVPDFFYITLLLSGVECPTVSADGKESEPFGREAKFFTEHFLLNRDVQIVIEGVDKYNFYGTVNYGGNNVSEELLKAGLGRYVDWSGQRTAFSEKLRAAEKLAKERKLRLWANFAGEPKLSKQEEKKSKTGKEIVGKVVKVINGQSVKISDSHHEFDVYLSSIKVPRQGNYTQSANESRSDSISRTWAWESREYLRKRLIGQRVRCVLDYVRPAFKDPKNNQKEIAERPCYSVYLDKNNVAVELVEAGLAQAQEHKGGEQRSREYELILFAENRAKKIAKGYLDSYRSCSSIIYQRFESRYC